MKRVTKIIFLTYCMVICTVICVNFVTADLTEHCVSKIHNLFEKCEDGCTTIEEQIEFIFLYVVPNAFTSSENKMVREYIEHIRQTIVWTIRFKLPLEFCRDFVPLYGLAGDTVNICLDKIRHFAPSLFNTINTLDIIYYNFSLEDEPMYYVWHYIEDVQKSVNINEDKLHGVNTPKLFCDMRICYDQIQVDIPNITSDEDMESNEYSAFIMLHADYRNFNHEHSKHYVDYTYNAIDKESTLKKMMKPKKFCKEYYKHMMKVCFQAIKNHNWAEYPTKNQYLKYMFYNLTQENTVGVKIGEEIINFTYEYMQNTSKNLCLGCNEISVLSPKEYCTGKALNNLN